MEKWMSACEEEGWLEDYNKVWAREHTKWPLNPALIDIVSSKILLDIGCMVSKSWNPNSSVIPPCRTVSILSRQRQRSKFCDETLLISVHPVKLDWMQDENRFASKGAHLNLKRAERARAAINKLPGMFLHSKWAVVFLKYTSENAYKYSL